jgi:hypothetical protein
VPTVSAEAIKVQFIFPKPCILYFMLGEFTMTLENNSLSFLMGNNLKVVTNEKWGGLEAGKFSNMVPNRGD